MVRNKPQASSWDPIWSFFLDDGAAKSLVGSITPSMEESTEPSVASTEKREEDIHTIRTKSSLPFQSYHKVSTDKRDAGLDLSSSYWEVDDHYFKDDDAANLLTHEEDDVSRRKVRFSPFKQVTVVEGESLSSVESRHCIEESRDQEANLNGVFSLTDFLEHWSAYSLSEESDSLELNDPSNTDVIETTSKAEEILSDELESSEVSYNASIPDLVTIDKHTVAQKLDGSVSLSGASSLSFSTQTRSSTYSVKENAASRSLKSIMKRKNSVRSKSKRCFPSWSVQPPSKDVNKSEDNEDTEVREVRDDGCFIPVDCKSVGDDTSSSVNLLSTTGRTLVEPAQVDLPTSWASHEVIVQVEASTISQTDSHMFLEAREMPTTQGMDFIGTISHINQEQSNRFKLFQNDRVMSLCRSGGHSRYISINPSSLVKVSSHIDSTQAICLAETYLAVFQALHHGQSKSLRYKQNSLKHKVVMILGSVISNHGRAIIELGKNAGVEIILAAAKSKYFHYLDSLGVVPLNKESLEWKETLRGRIDLILSLGEPVATTYSKLLKSNGELIQVACDHRTCSPTPRNSKIFCDRKRDQLLGRTHLHDVHQEWESNQEQAKEDLAFLLRKLENGEISPYVMDKVPLAKVHKVNELVESKMMAGFVICEPWLVSKSSTVTL